MRQSLNKITRTFGFIHSHPLAKKHLIQAYSRFVNWQLRTLFSNKLIPTAFIGSTKLLAKRGLTGITGNIYTGLHEFEDMCFLLHLLRESDTFFDVGANAGSYTILASGICGSRTLSFEPSPDTYEILAKNVNLNRLSDKVKILNSGVGNDQIILTFTSGHDTTNHVIIEPTVNQKSISVPVVKLDSYLNQQPILLKIDVEGFENEVIKGAKKLLAQNWVKAVIIELNGSGRRYGFNDTVIHQKLISLNFRPYQYEPFSRQLTEQKNYGAFNTIYIRDLRFVTARIKSAKTVRVFSQSI